MAQNIAVGTTCFWSRAVTIDASFFTSVYLLKPRINLKWMLDNSHCAPLANCLKLDLLGRAGSDPVDGIPKLKLYMIAA